MRDAVLVLSEEELFYDCQVTWPLTSDEVTDEIQRRGLTDRLKEFLDKAQQAPQ